MLLRSCWNTGTATTAAYHPSRLASTSFWRWSRWISLLCAAAGGRPLHGLTTRTTTTTSITMGRRAPSEAVPYEPPAWAKGHFDHFPAHGRLLLGNFPTPLYRLWLPSSDASSLFHTNRWYVKRDDGTGGVELGGNKVRKLEFLLADALAKNATSVITIGGEQSNHCRATAAACRMVGLEPHLILRTGSSKADSNDGDLGLIGNLLVDRMLQSRIYTCTTGEYGRIGSKELVARLATHLRQEQGREPYCIPVGGSNGLGTWGYVHAVQEMLTQWQQQQQQEEIEEEPIHHIVVACGSGGTAAGIALGCALAFAEKQALKPTVHAIGVCDDPNYFYQYTAGIAEEMGFQLPSDFSTVEDFMRTNLVVHQGKGLGYARSTPEELEFVQSFACATGIVLDPVYSGKALYNFVKYSNSDTASFSDSNILFWHTGGALGLYDKVPDLDEALRLKSPCQRMDIYGKGNGIDLSEPSGSSSS